MAVNVTYKYSEREKIGVFSPRTGAEEVWFGMPDSVEVKVRMLEKNTIGYGMGTRATLGLGLPSTWHTGEGRNDGMQLVSFPPVGPGEVLANGETNPCNLVELLEAASNDWGWDVKKAIAYIKSIQRPASKT